MNSAGRSLRVTPCLMLCLALGSAAAWGLAACSSREGFDDRKQVFAPEPEAGAPADAAPPVCGIHCSRDLKQVLDGCEGAATVVATCNADQGCGEGKCVDACTAAALSKGSAGCDFRTVFPNSPGDSRGSCFAAMIANTWDRPVKITAAYGRNALDVSNATYLVTQTNADPVYTRLEGPLPAGEIAVVFLSDDERAEGQYVTHCPASVTPAIRFDPMRYGTTRTEAFRIETDAPVSAYSIAPYGGFDSHEPTATLLLPVSSWSTSYIAVSPHEFADPERPRNLQIVASEDETKVSIRPTVKISPGVGVPGTEPGVAQTWTLAKGEVLQFLQASLTGSPIVADKPIAVFGGAQCSDVPGPAPACDMLQQQIPPFAQWGTEYAVVPAAPRIASLGSGAREQVPYTIVGAVEGTKLTYEPSRPRGAPETLGTGEHASFITDELFVVRSQGSTHPFHVNVYMTSANFGAGLPGTITTGDPDFANVPPVDQYLDRYVFLTDFTFPDTSLTIVRRKTPNGFMPVELACAGEVTGFSALGSSGQYEYAWVRLTSGFTPQKVGQGECGYGRHEARSDGPFAVTVWGVGPYSSYGYVGGTGLRPIHDAPPPVVK